MLHTPEVFPKPPTSTGDKADGLRTFEGDGTRFLAVPGLKTLHGLFVGGVPLPLAIEESYPDNATDNLPNQTVHEIPLVAIDRMDDGTPVIVRSIKSNDGTWQRGVKVQVDGDWEDDKQPDAGKGNAPDANGQVGKTENGQKGVPETK